MSMNGDVRGSVSQSSFVRVHVRKDAVANVRSQAEKMPFNCYSWNKMGQPESTQVADQIRERVER